MDATSLDSGSPRRDADVGSPRYLDTTAYPDISFICHQLRRQADRWVAAGTVTAHGATAPVDVALMDLTQDGGNLTIHASAGIDRYAPGDNRKVHGRTLARRGDHRARHPPEFDVEQVVRVTTAGKAGRRVMLRSQPVRLGASRRTRVAWGGQVRVLAIAMTVEAGRPVVPSGVQPRSDSS